MALRDAVSTARTESIWIAVFARGDRSLECRHAVRHAISLMAPQSILIRLATNASARFVKQHALLISTPVDNSRHQRPQSMNSAGGGISLAQQTARPGSPLYTQGAIRIRKYSLTIQEPEYALP